MTTQKAESPCVSGGEHILPRLAGSPVFGLEAKRYRELAGFSRLEVSTKINIGYSRLCAWERGVMLPPRSRQMEVEALDKALSADGKLLQAWLDSGPSVESLAEKCYRLHLDSWPRRLKGQWEALVDYKTQNSRELPRKADCRWSEATISGILGLIQTFMGYLLLAQPFKKEDLSLLLLCDWKLVKGFLSFKQQRSGRTHFTHTDEMFVRHYRSILRAYFPFLWPEAAEDPYWRDKLPEKATVQLEIVPGITRRQEFALCGPEEKWAAVVAEAVRSSERFSRSETFIKGSYTKLAQSFIDSKSAVARVGEILSQKVRKTSEEITDVSAAIKCRALAAASLLAVRAFRKGTVERLRMEHIRVVNGKVILDIPPSIVKNRKPIQGPLPDVPWLHDIILAYMEKARPMLVSTPDEGFWFTTLTGNGRRASHNVLYNDIRQVLGVNPHAMRYVLATDGKRNLLTDEDVAEVLGHTPQMTRDIYQKTDAEDRNRRANHTISKLIPTKA